jgi:transcriptional regulator with XRE-family HTH domain
MIDDKDFSFSERLKIVIVKKKLSQKKLSEMTGIDARSISRWKHVDPSIESIVKISDALECNMEWLKSGIGEMFDVYNKNDKLTRIETNEEEIPRIRKYRDLAEIDADTLCEIQTWINDIEKLRPGFTGWFRLEFQNRFPEFDEWKNRQLKKRTGTNN